MPHYINRSDFDKLPEQEKWLRISEGCVVVDDDWKEREIRAERVRAELAAWRKEHEPQSVKRADFDKLTQAERRAHIAAGGIVVD